MSSQGNSDAVQNDSLQENWALQAPMSPQQQPALLMPPLIFSPTASNNTVFAQQPPVLFSPILLPSPQTQANPQQGQFFQANQQPICSRQLFSPVPQNANVSSTANFSVQPIPGICIASPVSNNKTDPPAIDTSAASTQPQILASPQPNGNGTAITGFFSPTGGQADQYYMNQRFESLFLSPTHYARPASPTPMHEYYAYASSQNNYNNSAYQPYNAYNNMYNNSYGNCNQYYGKKTFNVLPKRRLEFHEQPSNSTKRDAVLSCLKELEKMFKDKIDDAGFRGPTALRIRVKTWNAIKHIVPFLVKANEEVKIKKVSLPKSTKGLGKVLRGFLAYMLVESLEEREKMQKLFEEYQQENNKPFKKLEITVK